MIMEKKILIEKAIKSIEELIHLCEKKLELYRLQKKGLEQKLKDLK